MNVEHFKLKMCQMIGLMLVIYEIFNEQREKKCRILKTVKNNFMSFCTASVTSLHLQLSRGSIRIPFNFSGKKYRFKSLLEKNFYRLLT